MNRGAIPHYQGVEPTPYVPSSVERTPLPGLDDLPSRQLPSVIKYGEIEQLLPQTPRVAEFLEAIFNI